MGKRITMRFGRAGAAVAAAYLAIAAPAFADVVMGPGPHPSDISMALQQQVIARHGGAMNRRVHEAQGSIVIFGDYGATAANAPFTLLLRDQAGWKIWRTGAARPVPAAAGAEIDRILRGDNFWRENGFVHGQPCSGVGRQMSVIHRGRDRVTRQLCGAEGLTGRLTEIAMTGRLPAGPLPPAGGLEETMRGARGSDYDRKLPAPRDPDSAELVMFLMGRSAYALRDGDITGHLAAYARDVTVVWPTGAEKGLAPLRRRAVAATWNGLDRRWLTPGEGFLRQLGPNRFRLDGTYHYFPGPTEMKVPFTAIWAKRRGRWEIVRQEIAAPVSVTPPRA